MADEVVRILCIDGGGIRTPSTRISMTPHPTISAGSRAKPPGWQAEWRQNYKL